ncbi:MAG: hypothetical protein JWQ03_1253 [Variovorax sp.]|nr:hypothetical protein [Variovorax sp.]
MSPRMWLPVCAALALTGCSTYRPAELAAAPQFPADIPDVTLGRPERPFPALDLHPFDARDGLDVTEVAMLAVVNNPDLRAARAGARITAAQSFSAGLLPEPQLNLTRDFPDALASGGSSAFVAGVSYAINALITHATTVEAGRQDRRQTDLNVLWQEWQVIAQARLLFVRLQAAAQRRDLLQRTDALLGDRYRRTRQALAAGLLTLDVVTPQFVALQDVERQLHDLDRQANQARFDLIALLGLAPGTTVALQGEAAFAPLDAGAIRARLPALLERRPDLQALRAGYAAQDARYRVALLGQFPALTLGVQRSRDTSNVYSRGFGITLGLPLFNRNRGEIRVQDATRDKLRAEYQQRLNTADTDIERVLAEQRISLRQLDDIDAALDTLHSAGDRMRAAFAARNADALTLATLEIATLAKESERIDARQAIQEQRIGMLTLTGGTAFGAVPATPDPAQGVPTP